MNGKNQPRNRIMLASSLLLLLIGVNCSKGETKQNTTQPNVIILLADDLGYNDLSITGSTFYETPNIDALAKQSVVFTKGYANAPVCSPSRASIMTGQFPSRHGITDWIGAKTAEEWREVGRHTPMLPATNKETLEAQHTTLAEALKAGGYATFIAGKWHIGSEEDGSNPEKHGFEYNIGAWEAGSPRGGYFDPYDNPKLPNKNPGESLTMRLANETLNFIKQHKEQKPEKPFFALLSFYAVHGPLQTTKDYWLKYRNKADSLGIKANGFRMGQYFPVRQVQDNPIYAGMVENMDKAIGHVLEQLSALGLEDNTIVIFTSDNGGVSSGDQYATSNLPLRAGKGSTFEGGIHVPFFMKVPMLAKAVDSVQTVVSGTDLFPTLLSLTKQKLLPKQHKDGQNLLPLLVGDTIPERSVIWHYPHYSNQDGRPSAAIRKGDWKLIVDFQTNEKELYLMTEDISEKRNLAIEKPEIVDALYSLYSEHIAETKAFIPIKDPNYDFKKEAKWLEFSRTVRLQNLETQRMDFLSPAFNPANFWWGSDVPK